MGAMSLSSESMGCTAQLLYSDPPSSWPIGSIKTPGFGRKGLVHKVIDFTSPDAPLFAHGYDDEVRTNILLTFGMTRIDDE